MDKQTTLSAVAGSGTAHLRSKGIRVVVVGGSAITLHAPEVYTSHDIDLAVVTGEALREVSQALAEINFLRKGREFAADGIGYTVDVVANVPIIDGEPIEEYALIKTVNGPVETYYLEDAVGDRVAAFVHWSDSQSLEVGERAVRAAHALVDPGRLERAFARLRPVGVDAVLRTSAPGSGAHR